MLNRRFAKLNVDERLVLGDAATFVIRATDDTETTVSTTEFAYLEGVTAGTALASKALVLNASKAATGIGGLTLTSPTGTGLGYGTGAGGAVTQATNRSTGVTLSKLTGTITGTATSLAAGAEAEFVVTNTTVAIGDVVILSIQSGPTTGTSQVSVSTVAAGSFKIKIYNHHASTADTGAPKINFAVIKAVSA